MAAAKGTRPPNAGKGRKPGSQNKVTGAFKAAVLAAFHEMGSTEALTKWGKENPAQFYQIAARLIPTEVTGDGGGPLHVVNKVVFEFHD